MKKTHIQPRRRSLSQKNNYTDWQNVLMIAKKQNDSSTSLTYDVTKSGL